MFTRWCFALVVIVIFLKYDAVLSSPLKIVNGTNAQLGDAPYMVGIRKKDGDSSCGGSIIAPDWVLTAAHCVMDEIPHGVIYGELRLYDGDDEWPENTVLVKRGIQHPKFNISGPIFDIALLQLEKNIPFSANVHAVQLPDSDDVPFHVDGLLTGWGFASEDKVGMIVDLQKLTVQLLSDVECIEKINSKTFTNFDPVQAVCIKNRNNGPCHGDSGGPYVINGVQYGVVSWSFYPCGSRPGVFSRISSPEQLQWIQETIKS